MRRDISVPHAEARERDGCVERLCAEAGHGGRHSKPDSGTRCGGSWPVSCRRFGAPSAFVRTMGPWPPSSV